MATQEETKQAVEDCLKQIGQQSRVIFKEFAIETYTAGGYGAGTWAYKFSSRSVTLEYWFSSFSTRKEEVEITYVDDDNREKLQSDLKDCFTRLHQIVKRKKGMF
jgi:hypothetical protein